MLSSFNSFAVFTDEQKIEAYREIAPCRIHLKEGEHLGKSVEVITIKMEIVKLHVGKRR